MSKLGRPGLSRDARVRFWDGVRAGLAGEEAAAGAGIGGGPAARLVREAGGVKGNGPGAVSGRYLRAWEREEIAIGLALELPCRQIAARLAPGRSASTVSREVRRNSVRGVYRAHLAQRDAEERSRRPEAGEAGGRCRAARVGTGQAGRRLAAGGDQSPAGTGVPGPGGDAGVARDDLPGAVRAGPRGAAPRARPAPADRAGAAPAAAQGRRAARPDPRHGDDRRPPGGGGGQGGARALGGRHDRRQGRQVADRHPGRADDPVHHAGAAARRGSPRRRSRTR